MGDGWFDEGSKQPKWLGNWDFLEEICMLYIYIYILYIILISIIYIYLWKLNGV